MNKLDTLGRRIKFLRENQGLQQSDLSKKIGVNDSGVISNWERDINKPNADKLILLCKALNTTLSFLLDYYGDEEKINPSEYEHIQKYRTLDERGKRHVDNVLDSEYQYVVDRQPVEYEPTDERDDEVEYDTIAANQIGEWTPEHDSVLDMVKKLSQELKKGKANKGE